MSSPEVTEPLDFRERCYALRAEILHVDKLVLGLREIIAPLGAGLDQPEMMANVILAHRHLEDARMRLGKAVQAFDGGASLYPR
jgi:hypothetical protein